MDDFYMDPNDLNDDAQLSIVDEAKLKVLDKIEEYVKLTKDAVRFQETGEYETNFGILARYISAMVDLNNIEDGEIELTDMDGNKTIRKLTDDELLEILKNIESGVEDISLKSLMEEHPDSDFCDPHDIFGDTKKNQDDDGSLDF